MKRASKAAGPFTLLAEGLTTPAFSETLPGSTLTYYYQVTAANPIGSSLPAIVSAKLTQPLPAPWLAFAR